MVAPLSSFLDWGDSFARVHGSKRTLSSGCGSGSNRYRPTTVFTQARGQPFDQAFEVPLAVLIMVEQSRSPHSIRAARCCLDQEPQHAMRKLQPAPVAA